MKPTTIVLAAPKSGSGKTTVTCALLQALKNRGKKVAAFKCGPDYIDPMFHRTVLEVPSENLDSYFCSESLLKKVFFENLKRKEAQIAVIEGVMGLYDGLGGTQIEGSTYEIAEILNAPIVLVVDARGMGRSVLALLAGFLQYDRSRLIKGVILNKVTKSFAKTLTELVETELGLKVFGSIPNSGELTVGSRHLGLQLPEEIKDLRMRLQGAAKQLEETVAVEDLLTPGAVEIKAKPEADFQADGPILAVARDEAFCFYYEENLRQFEKLGVRIAPFSPLRDEALPKDCAGIMLGGGYPELYAEQLSLNKSMHHAILASMEKDIPVLAECGGFMYLHEKIMVENGTEYSFVGALPGTVSYKGRPVRFGYLEMKAAGCEENKGKLLPVEGLKGHEFHYYDSDNNGNAFLAQKPVTGKTWECLWVTENRCLGFPHFYYASQPSFVPAFVKKMEEYKNREK